MANMMWNLQHKEFNSMFSNRKTTEYEIEILKGIDELQNFLINRYSNHKNFDKNTLFDICDSESFSGKSLKDFINSMF